MIPACELITGPTVEPVNLDEVKRNAFVTGTADDEFIENELIPPARKYIERMTGRAFITQTWTQFYDYPGNIREVYYFRVNPVQSVSSVKYYDTDYVLQTMSSALYQVDTSRTRARLWVEADQDWPTISVQKLNALQITFVAGYGSTPASVPEIYKKAIVLLCTYWYHNRGGFDCNSAGEVYSRLQALCGVEGTMMEYA